MTLPLRIQHGDIIETVLADSHVEHLADDDGPPVSTETWLAVKAHILALLATVNGGDQ